MVKMQRKCTQWLKLLTEIAFDTARPYSTDLAPYDFFILLIKIARSLGPLQIVRRKGF